MGIVLINSVDLSSYDPNARIVRLDNLRLDQSPQNTPPGLAHTGDIVIIYSIHSEDQMYVPTSEDVVKLISARSLEKQCTGLSVAPVFDILS